MTDHVYSDKDIFPGWDFDITTEEKISKEPIKILQESLDKMSDQEKKSFARQVVRKHTKYGAVSMFKGVEEIRFAKMKSFAKSVISDLRREIDSIELQISELEKELQESRITVSRGARDIIRLKKEILEIFPQVILPFKDLHYLKNKNLEYEDLPNDSRLLFNKKYNELQGELRNLILKVEECTRKIPELEDKLGPARHHLAVLRVEEDEIRPLDDKLNEINLQEKVEKEIVERFRIDRQEKRMVAANDRARKLKESLEIQKLQDKMLQEQKEKELKEKRKHLMGMLKEQMHEIEEGRRKLQEEEIEAKNKKVLALKKLDEKVQKIKDKIVPNTPNEYNVGKGSEIYAIKNQIKAKELKKKLEEKKNKERKEAMEERKMMILEKLIKENERFESKKKAYIPKKTVRFKDNLLIAPSEAEELSPGISEESISALLKEESKLLSGISSRQRKRLPPPKHKYVPPQTENFVLDGPPFSISKNKYDFVDYDPSKHYSQNITLTNISRRVNTFKIVSFPLEYSNIFSIQLDAPGYVNPGMKTKGKIFFHPPSKDFSEDIETNIELVAEWGGKFMIPISCKKKRADPAFQSVHGPGYKKKDFTKDDSFNNSYGSVQVTSNSASLSSWDHLLLDYGECTEGDRRSLTVEIMNQGALPCNYIVNAPKSHFMDYVYELDCDTESTLAGYGKMKIKVTFMPVVLDHLKGQDIVEGEKSMSYNFSIDYDNGTKLLVGCSGSRAKSSIEVQPKMVDFDLCTVGQTYKQKISLINHINIATKIWITAEGFSSNLELDRLCIQSDSIGDIEIQPSSAFVQSYDPFPISLTIIPNSEAAYMSNNGESEFELRIRINYLQKDGKRNYTPLYITGKITGNKILLSPVNNENTERMLDFGNLSVLECRHLDLKVENTSRAPQEVVLFSDDHRITIISDDTANHNHHLYMEPKATIIKTIRFEPDCYGPFSSSIVAKNKWNRTFSIKVQGFGLVPPLKFLKDQYVFPDTSIGTQKTTIFILKRNEVDLNELSLCQYEFGEPFPDPSNQKTFLVDPVLRLTPHIGVFSGKNIPIEVALTPNIQSKSVSQIQNTDQVLTEELETPDIIPDPEPKAPFLISYIVPCYLKPQLSEADRMLSLVKGKLPEETKNENSDKRGSFDESVIYFKISATICPPEIVLCDSSDSEINFGLVPLGIQTVKSIVIRNSSNHNIILKSNGLNPSGGFFLVKALREIKPDEIFEIKLGFKPDSAHIYREYFELVTQKTSLKVRLDGEGIFPELTIDSDDGSVIFEDTVIGETSVRKIKVWNKKNYPISFFAELASLVPEPHQQIFSFSNWNGKPAFNINPKRATVDPNSFAELEISFQPTIETDNYRDVLKLIIKGNESPLDILLLGRGWESSSYLSGYDLDTETPAIIPSEKSYSNVLKSLAGIDGFSVPDASGKGVVIDEENLAILAQSPYKKDTYFSTLTCYWKKIVVEGSEERWELDLKDIIVMNSKPPAVKLEGGKRSTECEYTIEPLETTFNYSRELNQFVMERSNHSPEESGFTFESLKGTVPIDSSTHLKLKVINPIRSYWQDFQEKWTQYGSHPDKSSENVKPKIHAKFLKQANLIESKLASYNVSKPFPMESCFRITLKGGYRYADPKGPMSPYDARVWILKVLAKVSD